MKIKSYNRIDRLSYGFDGEESAVHYVLTGDGVTNEEEIDLETSCWNDPEIYIPSCMAADYTLPVFRRKTIVDKVYDLTDLINFMEDHGFEIHWPEEDVIKEEVEGIRYALVNMSAENLIEKVLKETAGSIAIGRSSLNDDRKIFALSFSLELKAFSVIAMEKDEKRKKETEKI